ncbi:MAG: tetratricopeptide repeat protein [Acidobacteria bacterium]|nr:tetratricopeptide repeat protein [Acidobacteriota bacterium]
MANVGVVLRERSATADAEVMTRRALALRRTTRGEDSPEVAQSLRTLGLILTDRRAFVEADRVLTDVVARSRRVYPPAHPRLAEALVAWGRLRQAQNAPAAAVPAFREAPGHQGIEDRTRRVADRGGAHVPGRGDMHTGDGRGSAGAHSRG